MATVTVTAARGLYTSPNSLDVGAVPPGSLLVADNIIINHDNVIEPRRGFDNLYAISSTPTDVPDELFIYNNTLLVHYGTTLAHDGGSPGPFIPYTGSFAPLAPGITRMKGAESQNSFLFSTATGIQYMPSLAGNIRKAGIPRAPAAHPAQAASTVLSGGSWFAVNTAVAYRLVYGTRDVNNRLILGEPSERMVVINPADITIAIGNASVTTGSSVVTVTTTTNNYAAMMSDGGAAGNVVTINVVVNAADNPNFVSGTFGIVGGSITPSGFKYDQVTLAGGNATNGHSIAS